MKHEGIKPAANVERAPLQHLFAHMQQRTFDPHPRYRQPHLMTLASHFLKRPHHLAAEISEARIFEVEAGVCVLAHCNWQPDRYQAPTLVLAHGLEGSSQTHYMKATAVKALAA